MGIDDYIEYTKYFKDKSDSEKLNAIEKAEDLFAEPILYQYVLINIGKTIVDDGIKLDLIRKNIDFEDIIELIESLSDDTLKLEFLKYFNSDAAYAEIVKSFKEDSNKLKHLDIVETSLAKSIIIKSFKEDSLKLKYLSLIENEDYLYGVICSFDSDFLKLKYLKEIQVERVKNDILRSIENPILKKEGEEHINYFKSNYSLLIKGKEVYDESKFDELKEGIKVLNFKEDLLPGNLTIGLELELCFGNASIIKEYKKKLFNRWHATSDISLPINSVEINSPILHYRLSDMKELYVVCDFLKQNSLTTKYGSNHIHIGVNSIKNNSALKTLYELYSIMEKEIYLMSNEKGTLPRETVKEFARPISKNVEQALKEGHLNIDSEDDLISFTHQIRTYIQKSGIWYEERQRNYGINIINLLRPQNNLPTIEFRIPNITLNADSIHQNIKFFSRLIILSNELSNNEEIIDKLRTLNGEDKVIYFLKFLFKDEYDRNYFLDRYIVNEELERQTKFFNEDDFGKFKKDR